MVRWCLLSVSRSPAPTPFAVGTAEEAAEGRTKLRSWIEVAREASTLVDRSRAGISSSRRQQSSFSPSPSSPAACELAPHGGPGRRPSKVTRRHHNQVRRPIGIPFLLCQTRHPYPNLLFVLGSDLIAGYRGAGL